MPQFIPRWPSHRKQLRLTLLDEMMPAAKADVVAVSYASRPVSPQNFKGYASLP